MRDVLIRPHDGLRFVFCLLLGFITGRSAAGLLLQDFDRSAPGWQLGDRVLGAQLSDYNKRWASAWLYLDSMRLAEVRPDLGGIVLSSFRGGRMVLLYSGKEPEVVQDWGCEIRLDPADIGAAGPAPGELREIDRKPGRIVFDVPRESTIFIRTSEPADRFHFVPLEHEGTFRTRVWYPELIEKIKLGTVLRAPHLQAANDWYDNSPSVPYEFDKRTQPDATLQSARYGVAIEHLVDLANRAQTDLWYIMPARADDDAVRKIAEIIRDTLDPARRLFVECGNEVWNAAPPYRAQMEWMLAEAKRRGVARSATTAEREGGGATGDDDRLDDYALAQVMHAIRTVEMGRIVEEVLGEDRVTVVLAQQAGADWFHDLAARRLGSVQAQQVEALAIAPYFGHGAGNLLGRTTDARIYELLQDALGETENAIRRSAAAAQRHGWPLIAYEGGQHLVPEGGFNATDEARRQLRRVNESEQMEHLYGRWLRTWSQAGGGLLMHYGLIAPQDGRWGAWGASGATDSGATPKSRSLSRWAARPQ